MTVTWLLLWFMVGSVVLAIVPNQLAIQGTTVYLHRTLTHRSLRMPWRVELVFRTIIWVTTGIIARIWAAIHRKHHAHTDKDDGEGKRDPHSPYLEGFWEIQLGNVFHYRTEGKTPGLIAQYAKDIQPDVFDRLFFDRPLVGLGLGILTMMFIGFAANYSGWWINAGGFWSNGAVGASMGLVGALMHGVSYVFFQSSSINGLCHTPHRLGYQNSEDELSGAKTTFNNLFIAFLTGGEGLHNNHHWMQRSARFARTRIELLVDSGWWTIWTMENLGLVSDVRTAPLLT
jgi:stearoyl-CoA desaturase (Delta-9 desaturase)